MSADETPSDSGPPDVERRHRETVRGSALLAAVTLLGPHYAPSRGGSIPADAQQNIYTVARAYETFIRRAGDPTLQHDRSAP